MKAINISDLKNNLSRHLDAVRRGQRIVVLDRREPIAEIAPASPVSFPPWETLARAGKVVLGTQEWTALPGRKRERKVPIQKLLSDIRGDR